jgi:hypothetical protein
MARLVVIWRWNYHWQDMTFAPLPRGAHLKAIQQHGLKLLTEGQSKIARIVGER